MKKFWIFIFTVLFCLSAEQAWGSEGIIRYTIKKGECISKIAQRYHQTADLVAAVNNLNIDAPIKPGDYLLIPVEPSAQKIVLKRGDNAWDIAHRYGFRINILLAENDISDPTKLMPGDIITLPTAFNEEENSTPPQVVVKPKRKLRMRLSSRSEDKFLWPVQGPISCAYGPRWGDEFHHGIDIAVAYGTTITAAASGKVVHAGYKNDIYGKAVMIESGSYTLLYAHCSSILVDNGEEVSAGEAIARVGDSGRSTGPHLHFEVRSGGETLNPMRFLP